MTTKVGLSRLSRLAKLLRQDAANPEGVKFDLGTWGFENNPVSLYELKDEYNSYIPKVSCGTTACAIGLAVVSGIFAKDGLKNAALYTHKITPGYKNKRSFEAVQIFFGITNRQAANFFVASVNGEYQGAKAEIGVAKKIERFVREKRKAETARHAR